MSNIVLSRRHFNSTEVEMVSQCSTNGLLIGCPKLRDINPLFWYNQDSEAQAKAIREYMDTLRRLNVLSTHYHYYEGETLQQFRKEVDAQLADLRREHGTMFAHPERLAELSPTGLHKALCCIRYNIEASEIIKGRGHDKLGSFEVEALAFLEAVINRLADQILVRSTEWQNVKAWDIQ